MTLPYSNWNMQQARMLGFSTWDLWQVDWGRAGSTIYPSSTSDPGLDSTYGMVIGPRSTVDRVWVTETIPTNIVTGGVVPILPDGQRLIDITGVSNFTPTREPMTGPIIVNSYYDILAAPNQLYYPDGGALAPLPQTTGRFESPTLQLTFFLKPVTPGLIGGQRLPMERRVNLTNVAQTVGEELHRAYPIMGRRSIKLQARVPTGTVSFRIAGLTGPGGALEPLVERTLATGVVTGTATTTFNLRVNHLYLMIYRDVTTGPADIVTDFIALDDTGDA